MDKKVTDYDILLYINEKGFLPVNSLTGYDEKLLDLEKEGYIIRTLESEVAQYTDIEKYFITKKGYIQLYAKLHQKEYVKFILNLIEEEHYNEDAVKGYISSLSLDDDLFIPNYFLYCVQNEIELSDEITYRKELK